MEALSEFYIQETSGMASKQLSLWDGMEALFLDSDGLRNISYVSGSWSVHEEAQFFIRVLKIWELPQKLFQKSWLEDHWNREGISRKSGNPSTGISRKHGKLGKVAGSVQPLKQHNIKMMDM